MNDPEQAETLTFRLGRELSPLELSRLAHYAAKLGLSAEFVHPDMSNFGTEDILQDHLRRTYPPKSQTDYLGKEHFWRLGDDIGVNRRCMAKLFTELCFPTSGIASQNRASSLRHGRAYDPSKFGLVVASRDQVGLEDPGIPLGENVPNTRQILHQRQRGNELSVRKAVIQVEGIISLGEINSSPVESICTPQSRTILPKVFDRLRLLTDPQLTLETAS